jgi:hypothetical protein
MTDATLDVLSEPPDEPIIHWMERPPASLSPAALTGALAGVFVLGVVTTLAAIMLGRFMAGDEA